jgi:hypothetical protein
MNKSVSLITDVFNDGYSGSVGISTGGMVKESLVSPDSGDVILRSGPSEYGNSGNVVISSGSSKSQSGGVSIATGIGREIGGSIEISALSGSASGSNIRLTSTGELSLSSIGSEDHATRLSIFRYSFILFVF